MANVITLVMIRNRMTKNNVVDGLRFREGVVVPHLGHFNLSTWRKRKSILAPSHLKMEGA
jgi:hypothetical protein